MNKRIISLFLSFIMLVTSLSAFALSADAATYASQLKSKGFPDSYIEALVKLHNDYPNWKFEAFSTGLDFNDAVAGERTNHGNQFVEKISGRGEEYYCDCSKCKKNGTYVLRYSPNIVSASEWAVSYYMDPRNFLDAKHIFQFESYDYDSGQTKKGVEKILSTSWMANANITYVNALGEEITYKNSSGKTVTYSKAIMQAAKDNNLSPYFLASRIKKEVGAYYRTAGGVTGKRSPFLGMYNFFSIGAGTGALQGLEWGSGYLRTTKACPAYKKYNSETGKATKKLDDKIAADTKLSYMGTYGDYFLVQPYTTSGGYKADGKPVYIKKKYLRTTYFTYSRPWDNPYKAIYGGAQYISAGYKYQKTAYLQKFNVNKASGRLHSHEYMGLVTAPSTESTSTYSAYKSAGILKNARTFHIPVYKNMPESTKEPPTVKGDLDVSLYSLQKVKGVKVKKTTATTVTLKWKPQENAEGYYIYKYYPSKKKYKKKATVKGASTSSYKLKSLTSGKRYVFCIKAFNGDEKGKMSSKVTAVTKPRRVKVKALTSPSKTSLKLSWDKLGGKYSGYEISYSRTSDFKTVAATKFVSKKKTAYTGKNFASGRKYYVRIRAYKIIDGEYYYGKWSKVKNVKVK